MRRGFVPVTFVLAGFDWQGKTRRTGFAISTLLMVGLLLAWAYAHRINAGTAETVAILLVALWIIPANGHLLRRMNDAGWSGWAWWLCVIPFLGAFVILALLVQSPGPRTRFVPTGRARVVGFWALGLYAVFVASRVFWVPYFIPSGSMKPTLLVGDYAIALRITPSPEKGQIVVFGHPVTGQSFISRIIGLPGDTVQLIDGTLWVNGSPAQQTPAGDFDEIMEPQGPMGLLPRCANGAVGQGAVCHKTRLTERHSPDLAWDILDIGPSPFDKTDPFVVPMGSVFVLGDNRDNSVDSRFAQSAGGLGFVPIANLKSPAWIVAFSAQGDAWWKVWTWRPNRFLRRIR